MDFYNIDEIKTAGDCRKIAEELLGLDIDRDGRCTASWRSGTNPKSVSISDKGFTDFGASEVDQFKKGSIIDLVMAVKRIDITQTVELLGKHLNLKKTSHLPDAPQRKVVKEYIYKDKDGNPLHKTVRYEPKDFTQSHFVDGKWQTGLNGIKKVPYNLPEVIKANSIILVEGEKDADTAISLGYTATTVCGGAEAWEDYYNIYFKDKNIVIIADNDDKGKAHAKRITFELKDVAKAIKIIIPSNKPKGDLTDYIESGHKKTDLNELIKKAKKINLKEAEKPIEKKIDEEISKAKKLNKFAFKNYTQETYTLPDGKQQKALVARPMSELIHELFLRLLGFPRLLGDTLFDFDRDTHEIRTLDTLPAFTGWISEKTKHPIDFKTGSKFITTAELFEVLKTKAKKYDGLSYTNEYPNKEEKFYAVPSTAQPTEDHRYFMQLLKFFNPYNSCDQILLQALFASALYSPWGVDRPVWIIESYNGRDAINANSGKGIGKTSLIKMLAYLLGGYTFDSKQVMATAEGDYKNDQNREKLMSRILSASGRMKKIVLVDNITRFFSSETFASWITQSSFSGRPAYGRGETTRANDLTFCITSNSGTFGRDTLDRSMILCLEKPKKSIAGWELDVMKFIDSHRHQIIADIIHLLKTNETPNVKPRTRFKTWEKNILFPIVENNAIHEYVIEELNTRHSSADGDMEEGKELDLHIANKLESMGYLPYKNFYWIASNVIRTWILECIPNFGGFNGRHFKAKIRSLSQQNSLKNLFVPSFDIYPHNKNNTLGTPTRGILWIPDGEKWDKTKTIADIIRKANY